MKAIGNKYLTMVTLIVRVIQHILYTLGHPY